MSDEHLTSGVREFLKVVNSGASVESLPKLAARQVLIDAQKAFKVDYSGIVESEKEIEADGFTIRLNIVKPEGSKDGLPMFVFIHGGGWILGDYPTHKRLVRDLVVESGFAGVFVNYTPSPEAHYPQSINEIYAATKWAAGNGAAIGVDGGRLAVVGNSVGGNMTGVTGLMAKEQKSPEIKCLVMMRWGHMGQVWMLVLVSMVIVVAMAFQNAFGRLYSKRIYGPTTVMTGNVTSAALDIAALLLDRPRHPEKYVPLWHNLAMIGVFLAGCFIGGACAYFFGLVAVLVPGVVVLVMAGVPGFAGR